MFERFKQKNAKPTEMIADLDAMLVEPVSFQLHGKKHIIKPLETQQAFVLSNKFVQFQNNMTAKGLNPEEIMDGFYELIHAAVPTITRHDIEQAQSSQLTALFGFIVRSFTGELFAEKKTLKETMTQQNMSH
ncbi:MAG TPA: hypothetical protein DGG95_00650 [Cytophagales bacterium]|jgi:hypothetical protein|nr:hypothetical protein [Cytophagales bacterium]